MTREEAAVLTAMLTGATGGWNDEATTMLVREISGWVDKVAGQDAIERLSRTWKATYHPPLGVVVEAYQAALRHRQMEQRGLPSGERVVPPEEGYWIARRAYEAERRKLDKEPDWEFFDKTIGRLLAQPVPAEDF